MKRTKRLLWIAMAFFATSFVACVDDFDEPDQPVVSITAPVADTIDAASGDTLEFTLQLSSQSGLVSLQTTASYGIDIIDGARTFNATLSESVTVQAVITENVTEGDVLEVNFTVANSSKQTTAKKHVRIVVLETPLSEAKNFEWRREGGNPATGLETFGLTWTSNTATSAVIKKGADKFVELEPADWWVNLTTLEALKTAIDAAADMERWEKVSASDASKEYDLVLGTINSGTYYLIHITQSTVTVETIGSVIVINGQYKE
ncbi:MAG TPA: hypothetical protein PLK12_11935 [Prolixibacteraceae bacterium]|nr:hypothetical protein [Prolixibacteraceae bacterium]